MKERDVNFGFFHAYIKIRSITSIILALKVGGNRVERVAYFWQEIFKYFFEKFLDPNYDPQDLMVYPSIPCLR